MTQENTRPNASEQLLIAAEELFSARGYSAVSTREVAEAAGVNLAAIQYHFGSKAKLFVATVHRMMQRNISAQGCFTVNQLPMGREAGVAALTDFVRGFLEYLLRPVGPHACRVMFREVFLDEVAEPDLRQELITSFVEHYMRPTHASLEQIVRAINPKLTSARSILATRSIIGQCSFYVSHRPFVEYLGACDLSAVPVFDEIVRHIVQFSVSGLMAIDY